MANKSIMHVQSSSMSGRVIVEFYMGHPVTDEQEARGEITLTETEWAYFKEVLQKGAAKVDHAKLKMLLEE